MTTNEAPGTSALLMTIQILGDQLDAQQRELTEIRRQLGNDRFGTELLRILREIEESDLCHEQFRHWFYTGDPLQSESESFRAGWEALSNALYTIAEAREKQTQAEASRR